MRKLFSFLLMFLVLFCVKAQDRIITTDGDVIQAYRVDIGGNAVYYKLDDTDDASLQSISKDKIVIIKYIDGKIINFEKEKSVIAEESDKKESDTETDVESSCHKLIEVTDLTEKEKLENDRVIGSFNQEINCFGEKNNKKASIVVFRFGIMDNSVMSNDDIEINIVSGNLFNGKNNSSFESVTQYNYLSNPAIRFQIKNKHNRTIYIDLGNTFYTNLGESVCFYIPSSTTKTSTTSSGLAFNLGGVTNALGLGGVVSSLANATTVGGKKSKGLEHTIYSQRVIAIAPNSSFLLPPQYLFGKNDEVVMDGVIKKIVAGNCPRHHLYFSFNSALCKLKYGERLIYSMEKSPINLSFVLSYSYTEDCAKEFILCTRLYMSEILGVKQYSEIKSLYRDNKGLWYFGRITSSEKYGFFPRPEEMK